MRRLTLLVAALAACPGPPPPRPPSAPSVVDEPTGPAVPTRLGPAPQVTVLAVAGDEVFYGTSDGWVMRLGATVDPDQALGAGTAPVRGLAVDADRLYWTEGDLEGGTLRSVPRSGGKVAALVTGLDAAGAVAVVDDGLVYLAFDGVYRVPREGGAAVRIGRTDGTAVGLCVSAGQVFFGDDRGSIRSVPLAGGDAVSVLASPGLRPRSLACDAAAVFVSDAGGRVLTAPAGGGKPTVLAEGEIGVDGLAVDGRHVYWTRNRPDGALVRAARDGGSVEILAKDQPLAGPIVVDRGRVLWADTGRLGVVMAVGAEAAALPENQVPFTVAWDQAVGSDILIDDTDVYWTTRDSIRRVAKSGSEPEVAVANLGAPRGLILDGPSLFWVGVEGGTTGAVFQRLKTSGSVITLATKIVAPWGLAVDVDNVYVSSRDGAVLRLTRGGGKVQKLVSNERRLARIFVDGDAIFVASGEGVLRLSKAGGQRTLLAPAAGVVDIALDGGFVYFAAGEDGRVARVRSGGGAVEVLAEGEDGPAAIVAADNDVYWGTFAGAVRTVNGFGEVRSLASGQGQPIALALDADALYWTAPQTGSIMRIGR